MSSTDVDPRPLLAGSALVVVVIGIGVIVGDLTDVVTNDAEFSIGWFAFGLALTSAVVVASTAATVRLFRRGAVPLVAPIAGAAVSLLAAVLGLVAFSATGSALLYFVGAAGTLVSLAVITLTGPEMPAQ